jgi:hypothetical protein
MAEITKTFTYLSEDANDEGYCGWVIEEMGGFSAIPSEITRYNSLERMTVTMTHDGWEHTEHIARGTIANEIAAFGVMWFGRRAQGLITAKQMICDFENLIDTISNGLYEDLDPMEFLEDEIPPCDYENLEDPKQEDFLRRTIADVVNNFSSDHFGAGDMFCDTLIDRWYGWMIIGKIDFEAKYPDSGELDVFSSIREELENIFRSVDSVLYATGNDDLSGYFDEFPDDFTVCVTVDTVTLEVTAFLPVGTNYLLGEIRSGWENNEED